MINALQGRIPRCFLSAFAGLALFSGCTLENLRPSSPPAPVMSNPELNTPLPRAPVLKDSAAPPTPAATESVESPKDLWVRIRRGLVLPDNVHRLMQNDAAWFRGHKNYLDQVVERARPFLYLIVEELDRRDLPMDLALLPVVESGYQASAYSSGHAAGLWQFIPATARRYGLKKNWWYDGRKDVPASTGAALDYLEMLHEQFGDDWLLAIAAYNCGEGTVRSAMRRNQTAGRPVDFWHLDLPRETREYVPRLLALSQLVADPESAGIHLPSIPNRPVVRKVDLGGQIDLALAAELADMTLDELYRMNPAFNRWATDPDGPHYLLLPTDKARKFAFRLSEVPAQRRVRWQRHRILDGESLSVIARRYSVTVAMLQKANHLKGTRIRSGRDLLVPHTSQSPVAQSLRVADSPASAPSPGAGKRVEYRIRSGDSLWRIARQYGVHVKDLADWNGLSSTTLLRPGQTLDIRVPNQQTIRTSETNEQRTRLVRHTVRPGESLWLISRRFQVSVADLKEWNDLVGNGYLQPGQELIVYLNSRSGVEPI